MEVVILAGGLGTRLRSSIGTEIPKCMAPIGSHPFLWYLLETLRKYDISRVILSVGHLREVIFKWIDEHKNNYPFEFTYAVEETPLGTGGGIRLAMESVKGDNAVILNGDTLFDANLDSVLRFHNKVNSTLTLALKPMTDFDRYGRVEITDNGLITKFCEKEFCKEGLINGGVYVLSKKQGLWDSLPTKFSFETDFMQVRCGENGDIYGITDSSFFLDIGIPADYEYACREFPSMFGLK